MSRRTKLKVMFAGLAIGCLGPAWVIPLDGTAEWVGLAVQFAGMVTGIVMFHSVRKATR